MESLEPRLLLSGLIGIENSNELPGNDDSVLNSDHLTVIQVDYSLSDSSRDILVECPQLSSTISAGEVTIEDSSLIGLLDSQPASSGIDMGQFSDAYIGGQEFGARSTDEVAYSSSIKDSSMPASCCSVAAEEDTSFLVNDGVDEPEAPVEYETSNLSSSTEELVDMLHAPNPPLRKKTS